MCYNVVIHYSLYDDIRGKNMKRKAPEKECPNCNALVHARVSKCKSCKHVFYIKKNVRQEALAKNWRNLKAKDEIKVFSGSGTYFLSKDKRNPDGSPMKISMGHKGKFEVIEVIDEGSRSCGIIGRKIYPRYKASVREYIYMGESYVSDNTGLHMQPHKIKVTKIMGEASKNG